MPLYFEDLEKGMTLELPPVTITREMREAHVRLYGEDWCESRLEEMVESGVIPSSLVLSIIGGQFGLTNWINS